MVWRVWAVRSSAFRAIGKLLGGSGEKFEAVAFHPGASALLLQEQAKLKTFADALEKRPALALSLSPGYNPAADRCALKEQVMRREAAAIADVKLATGEVPGPVDVNHCKVQNWVEDRYAALVGKHAYHKSCARAFAPRTPVPRAACWKAS